jgi:hypothetical protein
MKTFGLCKEKAKTTSTCTGLYIRKQKIKTGTALAISSPIILTNLKILC